MKWFLVILAFAAFALVKGCGTMEVVSDAGSTDQQWVSPNWRIVNDDVMGGYSVSTWSVQDTNVGIFEGVVSLRNNGGFASVRSPFKNELFKDAVGVKIRLVGDQNLYRFCLRSAKAPMGISYQADIATSGLMQDVFIPFSAFQAKWRGRPVPEAPMLRPKDVIGVGLLISNQQAGPFRLEVHSIEPAINTMTDTRTSL